MFKRLSSLAIILVLIAAAPAQTKLTAIKAGKLVDPETGGVTTGQVIIIEGRRIKAIGPNLSVPSGAEVIDLSNSAVLPGLFDCHTHMCSGTAGQRGAIPGTNKGFVFSYAVGNTTAYRAIQGVANSLAMLQTGFTTIRDVGNAGNYADTDLRRAIDEGLVPGPTIINAGRIIAPYGGQYASNDRGYTVNPENRKLGEPEYLYADTTDELRKAVHENIFYGALVIKLVVDDQRYIYSADDLRFVVEEARRAGVKVATHCVTEAGAHNAAEAGVASIEHGFNMSDETLALAKKNNVVLVGTDFTQAYWTQYGMDDALAKRLYERSVDRIRRAYKIGTPMAFASDIILDVPGQSRGEVCLSIMDTYVDAGLPAKYLLQMMTVNAARLLGVEKQRGSLKVGLAADLIATPSNPIEDINTLKRVSFVMKNGTVIKYVK
jgi:imidazolonepropionase-like amidohydrolase